MNVDNYVELGKSKSYLRHCSSLAALSPVNPVYKKDIIKLFLISSPLSKIIREIICIFSCPGSLRMFWKNIQ